MQYRRGTEEQGREGQVRQGINEIRFRFFYSLSFYSFFYLFFYLFFYSSLRRIDEFLFAARCPRE